MTIEKRIYFLALAIACGQASKCPEPRKPHPTSCTIFYNCVNLPGGGYVWAPAKCTDGLVFQPYLRMCVLPGDSWLCDNLATETPEMTKKYQTPELVDPTQNSYLADEEATSRFSEPIDSSYVVDDFYDPNEQRTTVTPYPLIEVTATSPHGTEIDNGIPNIGIPIAIKHSEDNYLYHFVDDQQALSAPINMNYERLKSHLEHLSRLIDRLTAYEGSAIPLDRQVPPRIATTSTTTTTMPQPPTEDAPKKYIVDNHDSAILNFLVKNYLLKTQVESTVASEPSSTTGSTTTTTTMEAETPNNAIIENDYDETTRNSVLDIAIDGPEAANNIIVVKDSLSNVQYFTIEKYKTIAEQLTTETVTVLPCTSGVRLPNTTDCRRYYSCDPNSAAVAQFSCPPNTAFNEYKRVCDTKQYSLCVMDSSGKSSVRISLTTAKLKTKDAQQNDAPAENPCHTIGKHGDPTSETHYYLCYSGNSRSADIQYQRMKCPNGLTFCQGKNVCTTKKRCTS